MNSIKVCERIDYLKLLCYGLVAGQLLLIKGQKRIIHLEITFKNTTTKTEKNG